MHHAVAFLQRLVEREHKNGMREYSPQLFKLGSVAVEVEVLGDIFFKSVTQVLQGLSLLHPHVGSRRKCLAKHEVFVVSGHPKNLIVYGSPGRASLLGRLALVV